MTRRVVAIALVSAVVLTALAVVGRVEAARRADEQVRGMQRVVRQIGALENPSLESFRYSSFDLQCLLYRRDENPFALELCFDEHGRVIETIDRRTAPEPRIHSLRDDPSRSTLRIDRAEATRLLIEMGLGRQYLPRGTP